VEVTGDKNVLDARIRYIESPVLAKSEHERYEEPLRSETKESLYMHCVRALEHGFRFGAHGLVLMGSGDWNDGMNAVGIEGKGESVWGSMFLLYVLAKFLPLCEMRGDEEGARRYKKMMKTLALSIETHAWNGSWYLRAWYDDGTPMGERGQAEAEIDLLPQGGGVQMICYIKICVIIIFHRTEHVLFIDDVIFITEIEGGCGREKSAIHRHIPRNIVLVRISIEEFIQFLQKFGIMHEKLLSSHFRRVAECKIMDIIHPLREVVNPPKTICVKFVNFY
jgi:hypothetical protein